MVRRRIDRDAVLKLKLAALECLWSLGREQPEFATYRAEHGRPLERQLRLGKRARQRVRSGTVTGEFKKIDISETPDRGSRNIDISEVPDKSVRKEPVTSG